MPSRQLWSIEGNTQWLDGGAMFGNAPRVLWSRWITPDDDNRIPLSCRALLVREPSGRVILFETGIGAYMRPALRRRYGVLEDEHRLIANLQEAGFDDGDVDVVVLSHLHFDHAGGVLDAYREGQPPRLRFERATFVVSERAWERARAPHPRDRASFIPELPALLEASGRLEVVAGDTSPTLGADYRLHFSDGHTPGLMLSELPGNEGPVVFAADLIPGSAWLHAPITMGYDRYPELLVDEKQALLSDLVARGGRLFFTHDSRVALAEVGRDEKGRYKAGRSWSALQAFEA